jgi:hypothetical protein
VVINPRLPTDQLAQYRTSVHGELLLNGNARVATCVSCHGTHGIRSARDPASTASKERIVETCSVAAGFLLLLAVLLARKARQFERRRLGLEA